MARAGLNEREAPGKVVTARPLKRIAQLRSVSHNLVSTLQKHRPKTSKLIRFGSLHFRSVATGGFQGQCPPNILLHPKFCCAQKYLFLNIKNTKILPPKNVFCPFKSQNLATGLLHFRDIWG